MHRPHLHRDSAHICGGTRPTSAVGLGSLCPHLRRDSAASAHICRRTRPTSAAGLGPHLRRDSAASAHICTGTRPTSAPGRYCRTGALRISGWADQLSGQTHGYKANSKRIVRSPAHTHAPARARALYMRMRMSPATTTHIAWHDGWRMQVNATVSTNESTIVLDFAITVRARHAAQHRCCNARNTTHSTRPARGVRSICIAQARNSTRGHATHLYGNLPTALPRNTQCDSPHAARLTRQR